jgi:hypothetical protein
MTTKWPLYMLGRDLTTEYLLPQKLSIISRNTQQVDHHQGLRG